MEMPTKLKAVLGFRAFEFPTTHSFIHYKFSPLIHLLYTEFGLLYTAHKLTLWAIAPWLCKTECLTVFCVYYMPKKVCEITTIPSKKQLQKMYLYCFYILTQPTTLMLVGITEFSQLILLRPRILCCSLFWPLIHAIQSGGRWPTSQQWWYIILV